MLRRAVLALASIPIAIAANAVRIFGTGLCVQYWDPDKALGFFHEFSGWVMFLVSLGCLFIVHRTMRLFRAEGGRHEEPSLLDGRRRCWPELRCCCTPAAIRDLIPASEPVSQVPRTIAGWSGSDVQIDQETLDVLGSRRLPVARLYP